MENATATTTPMNHSNNFNNIDDELNLAQEIAENNGGGD